MMRSPLARGRVPGFVKRGDRVSDERVRRRFGGAPRFALRPHDGLQPAAADLKPARALTFPHGTIPVWSASACTGSPDGALPSLCGRAPRPRRLCARPLSSRSGARRCAGSTPAAPHRCCQRRQAAAAASGCRGTAAAEWRERGASESNQGQTGRPEDTAVGCGTRLPSPSAACTSVNRAATALRLASTHDCLMPAARYPPCA